MYSMSVSIHHIYSSVTLIFSLVSSGALHPSENSRGGTCTGTTGDILESSHIPPRSLWEEEEGQEEENFG